MKYIGSKAKIAADIVPILQGYINEYGIKQYVEPFVGGFNIIDKIECENRLGNDIDPLVCELVETCRENPTLLDGLTTPTREEYYDVRDKPEKYAALSGGGAFVCVVQRARVWRVLRSDCNDKGRYDTQLFRGKQGEFQKTVAELARHIGRVLRLSANALSDA